LTIDGLENVPAAHFWKIQRGLPGRDEQIENYHRTVRNLGRVGIPLLGFNFLATYVWRTDMQGTGRGGARVTSFDLDAALHTGNALADYKLSPGEPITAAISADEMWDNYQYFLDAVLPVARRAASASRCIRTIRPWTFRWGAPLGSSRPQPPSPKPIGGRAAARRGVSIFASALSRRWPASSRSTR
jgi:hypothetical protein